MILKQCEVPKPMPHTLSTGRTCAVQCRRYGRGGGGVVGSFLYIDKIEISLVPQFSASLGIFFNKLYLCREISANHD